MSSFDLYMNMKGCLFSMLETTPNLFLNRTPSPVASIPIPRTSFPTKGVNRLSLSLRPQVKKLLNKPVVKESCYYRKLTDLGKDETPPSFIDAQVEHLLGEFLTVKLYLISTIWLRWPGVTIFGSISTSLLNRL